MVFISGTHSPRRDASIFTCACVLTSPLGLVCVSKLIEVALNDWYKHANVTFHLEHTDSASHEDLSEKMHKLDITFQKVLFDIVQHLYLLVTRCLYLVQLATMLIQ